MFVKNKVIYLMKQSLTNNYIMEYKTEKMMYKYVTASENRNKVIKFIIGGTIWFFTGMGFMYGIAITYAYIWRAL